MPADEVTTQFAGAVCLSKGGSRTAMSWAPDGNSLFFIGQQGGTRRIYKRPLAMRGPATALEGTDGSIAMAASPDGSSIAFVTYGDERDSRRFFIKAVPVAGGPVVPICEVLGDPPEGLAWSPRNEIIFSNQRRLWRVPAHGGTPEGITEASPTVSRELVSLLPGGTVVLYNEREVRNSPLDRTAVIGQRITTGERKRILTKATDARYLPTGHLVFMRNDKLFAVRFDADRLETIGEERIVLDKVEWARGTNALISILAGQFAISSTGHLAYISTWDVPPTIREPVAVDRGGHATSVGVPPGEYYGQATWLQGELCLSVREQRTGQLVVLDRGRRFPFGDGGWHAWSRDRGRVAMLSGQEQVTLYGRDGTRLETISSTKGFAPSSWSPDGRFIVGTRTADYDLYLLSMDEPGRPLKVIVPTEDPARATNPEISPDGHWMAYRLDNPTPTVVVQAFPRPGRSYPVSVGQAVSPAWNPRGGELFYVLQPEPGASGDPLYHMMAVTVDASPSSIRFGDPRPLFPFKTAEWSLISWPTRNYDVRPDGQSFLIFRTTSQATSPPKVTHINLILNWFEELKAKVPAGGAK